VEVEYRAVEQGQSNSTLTRCHAFHYPVLGYVDLHVGPATLPRAESLVKIQELPDFQEFIVTSDACGDVIGSPYELSVATPPAHSQHRSQDTNGEENGASGAQRAA
jgi:hypothetical protein